MNKEKKTIGYYINILSEIKANEKHNYSDEDVKMALKLEESSKEFCEKFKVGFESLKPFNDFIEKIKDELEDNKLLAKFLLISDVKLKENLTACVEEENYEEAALIRDEIKRRAKTTR